MSQAGLRAYAENDGISHRAFAAHQTSLAGLISYTLMHDESARI